MTEHEVKILKPFFEDILRGVKTFEVRYNDKNFQVGDVLILKEINRDEEGSYTGRELSVDVKYVYSGDYCKRDYCIMSIELFDDGWVDAQKNPPPITDTVYSVSDSVLVLFKNGLRQTVCYYVHDGEDNYWTTEDNTTMYEVDEIEYWRPLPNPPKRSSKKGR